MRVQQKKESKQLDQNKNSNKQSNQNKLKIQQKEQQVQKLNENNQNQLQEVNEVASNVNQNIKDNVQEVEQLFKVDKSKATISPNITTNKSNHKKNEPIMSMISEQQQKKEKKLIQNKDNFIGQSQSSLKQKEVNSKLFQQSKKDKVQVKINKQKIEQNQNQVEQSHNHQNQINKNTQIVNMQEEQNDKFIEENQFNNNDKDQQSNNNDKEQQFNNNNDKEQQFNNNYIEQQFNNNDKEEQFDPHRLKITVNAIKALQSNSLSAQKLIENQYKYYIQFRESKTELFQNYGIKHMALRKELSNTCNAIQKVRGDGNCFYYAFGYQFLTHLMFTYSENKFSDFINWILDSKIRFQITAKDFKIDDIHLEKTLLEEFLFQLCEMRKTNEELRRDELFTKFREFEIHGTGLGCFCYLSTIFFRNLSNFLLDKSPQKDAVFDRINLLIWEEECDNNEVIIANLAEQLGLYIKLIFFQDEDFNLREYGNQNKPEIILLIHPGHYNIGIKQ